MNISIHLFPQWYKNDDKYEYGINSTNSDYYILEIWYNSHKNKYSDKFFKDHSILCEVNAYGTI